MYFSVGTHQSPGMSDHIGLREGLSPLVAVGSMCSCGKDADVPKFSCNKG